MGRGLAIVLLILAATLLAALFGTLNPQPVTLELALGRFTVPLWLAVIGAFIAGLAVGLACGALAGLRLLNERRRLRRSVRLAEAEVTNLRTLPMQDAE